MGFWDDFRRGRDEVRAGAGMPPSGTKKRNQNAGQDRESERSGPGNSWHGEERDDYGQGGWDESPPHPAAPGVAELEAALRERDEEMQKALQIMQGLKDYAEQLQAEMAQLTESVAPMAKALKLPGVKTFLLQRFHPDKHPDADERQKKLFTEAMQVVTAAYASIAKEFHEAD